MAIPFNNSGTLKAQTGDMELADGGDLGGQFVAEADTAIDFTNGSFTLNGAAPAAGGAGLVQFTGFNANITCIGPMSGVLNCSLASIVAPLTIAANGTLNILGIGVAIDSSFTNSGTVNWLGTNVYLGAYTAGPLVNLPGGVWNIQSGQIMSTGYSSDADAYFTNAGTVLMTNNSVPTDISIPFINAGTLIADTGTLLFESGYGQSSTGNLLFSLGGPNPGTDYSQFQFTYAPVFAGAFTVTTENGYQPGVGAAFTVLDYPSFTGAFSSTNLNLGGGIVLQPQFNATNLVPDRRGRHPADPVHLDLRRERDRSVDTRLFQLGPPIRNQPRRAQLDNALRHRQFHRHHRPAEAAAILPHAQLTDRQPRLDFHPQNAIFVRRVRMA